MRAVPGRWVRRAVDHLLDPHTPWRWGGRVLEAYWRWRFAEFGSESLLYKPEFVFRPELMAIGERVWIGQRAWMEVSAATPARDEPVIRVGDGAVLRHHVTLLGVDSVVIEDDVLI